MQILQPPGWAQPIGYANGIAASGKLVFVAGQVGWIAQGRFHTDDFVEQTRQALANVVAVVAEAGGKPDHVVSMTWYLASKGDYQENLKAVGEAWRATMGHHFPAMAVVEVSALMEDRAKIAIQAMAVIPEG